MGRGCSGGRIGGGYGGRVGGSIFFVSVLTFQRAVLSPPREVRRRVRSHARGSAAVPRIVLLVVVVGEGGGGLGLCVCVW